MGASNSRLHFSALLKYIIAPIYNFPHCSCKGPSDSLQAERQASEHFHVLVQDPARYLGDGESRALCSKVWSSATPQTGLCSSLPRAVEAIRQVTNLLLDVHLMIEQPERYLEAFVKAGGNWIGVQVEAVTHLHRLIQNIRELGAKATVVLNPATSLTTIENALTDVDMVLIVTVNPGFGGQKFIHTMLPKVRRCREMIDERNCSVLLEVDGGVHEDTLDGLVEAGVDVFVAGSAIFGKGDNGENICRLKAHIRKER